MVQDKEFYLDKKEMKRAILKRCVLCGKDQENLFPMVLKVNDATWTRLHEIATSENKIHLNSTGYHNPYIDRVLDDLTLKPIKGTSYEVSIEMCEECIDKIGYRHKFRLKHAQMIYATKLI